MRIHALSERSHRRTDADRIERSRLGIRSQKPIEGVGVFAFLASEGLYRGKGCPSVKTMYATVRRLALLGAHQLTVTVGILLFPLALAASRAGIRFPIHRLVETTGEAYQRSMK